MLRRQLETHRDAPCALANLGREVRILAERCPVGKPGRGNRGLTFLEAPDLCNLPFDLVAGQMPARAGLGPLPALEMKRLGLTHLVPGEAETCRRELVEVPRVRFLLIGQHAALARTDSCTGMLGTFGERDLRLFGESAETHIRYE